MVIGTMSKQPKAQREHSPFVVVCLLALSLSCCVLAGDTDQLSAQLTCFSPVAGCHECGCSGLRLCVYVVLCYSSAMTTLVYYWDFRQGNVGQLSKNSCRS
jgi:hypothetical protein